MNSKALSSCISQFFSVINNPKVSVTLKKLFLSHEELRLWFGKFCCNLWVTCRSALGSFSFRGPSWRSSPGTSCFHFKEQLQNRAGRSLHCSCTSCVAVAYGTPDHRLLTKKSAMVEPKINGLFLHKGNILHNST